MCFIRSGNSMCGGLTLAGLQVPTKVVLLFPSSAGQGRENTTKGSQIEIRTGRGHSPVSITAKQAELGEKV